MPRAPRGLPWRDVHLEAEARHPSRFAVLQRYHICAAGYRKAGASRARGMQIGGGAIKDGLGNSDRADTDAADP